MKFTQSTSEEIDGSNTWETTIQEFCQNPSHCKIKIWYNDTGFVSIETGGGVVLAEKTFSVKGQEETEKRAIKFAHEYFHSIYSLVADSYNKS